MECRRRVESVSIISMQHLREAVHSNPGAGVDVSNSGPDKSFKLIEVPARLMSATRVASSGLHIAGLYEREAP